MRLKHLFIALVLLPLSGCAWFSDLVYKVDIPQGNYIDEQQVEKLRVGMTKEQVKFVLGTPMVKNSFRDTTWYYVYRLKTGKGAEYNKRLIAKFDDQEKLASVEGDYELSPEFSTPIGS
ncbi:outer membrane protein assembly factor BamE [Corallincola platygyrae]|uniref:Outer membrane protein assembly factor BamE n=1 Tax=Corallincola platygyrae TaxID=1193278 RepID=A0ABW4XJT4_9GAMM